MLLLVAAAVHGSIYHTTEAAVEDSESLVGEVDAAQANFQSTPEERDHCAPLKKDCSAAKCRYILSTIYLHSIYHLSTRSNYHLSTIDLPPRACIEYREMSTYPSVRFGLIASFLRISAGVCVDCK